MVWVVSLSGTELIPRTLTPGNQEMAFGVWLNLEPLRALVHPVLYLHISIPRLYLNIFRTVPAITEFD